MVWRGTTHLCIFQSQIHSLITCILNHSWWTGCRGQPHCLVRQCRDSFFPTSTLGPWIPLRTHIFVCLSVCLFVFCLTHPLSYVNHCAYASPSNWKLVWINQSHWKCSFFQSIFKYCLVFEPFWIIPAVSEILKPFLSLLDLLLQPFSPCFSIYVSHSWIGWNSRKYSKCLGLHCIWQDAFYSSSRMGKSVLPWPWARTLANNRDSVFNPRRFCSEKNKQVIRRKCHYTIVKVNTRHFRLALG